MNVKTDTKEKFTVITPLEGDFSANMADEWGKMLLPYAEKQPPHVIINMQYLAEISDESLEMLASCAADFRSRNHSFVVCSLQKGPLKRVEEMELLEILNYAPTESEAWDIVQMEEIERELFSDDSQNEDQKS